MLGEFYALRVGSLLQSTVDDQYTSHDVQYPILGHTGTSIKSRLDSQVETRTAVSNLDDEDQFVAAGMTLSIFGLQFRQNGNVGSGSLDC